MLLTHGLRAVSDGRPAAEAFGPVASAVLTAACRLLAAGVTFHWSVAVPARRAGTLALSYWPPPPAQPHGRSAAGRCASRAATSASVAVLSAAK
ncbi:hypothetical protein ACIBJC_08480 [Streptomyces sp. NPDC050509]|uniref:hypothetical protein n=1 Tax=Streptomyces sp. NPDC050509 TaxID=3365620 RepID=UPI003790B6FB